MTKIVKIILVVLLGLICLGQMSNWNKALQTSAAPRQQKLSPVEKCANGQLYIDRSLSVQQAFDICEMPPEKQFETWLATRSRNRQ